MNKDHAMKLAESAEFSHWGIFPTDKLRFLPEVRGMCAADLCHQYGKSWSCPPGCGTLEEIREKTLAYDYGLLLQTTAQMEDEFDVEAMMEAEKLHKERFESLCRTLAETDNEPFLPMGAGSCEICPSCTYPDSPCRFPDRMTVSMEAYGLVVSNVCELAGVPYYYGPLTITYTCCILFQN